MMTSIQQPSQQWEIAACKIVAIAEDGLWSSGGECALAYLLERGLTVHTIRSARLGYVSGRIGERRDIAGLDVPCGMIIPWFAADMLWAVSVRQDEHPRHVQIAGGSKEGLYNADSLRHNLIALICDCEVGVLLIQQEAGDLVAPVTLRSATARLTARWYGKLMGQRQILIANGQGMAGQRGTRDLLKFSPRLKQLRLPEGKTIPDFLLNGGDIHAWISEALQEMQPEVNRNVY
ncbi:hypothetical protein G4Y79_18835 [Phototrophicus methaneseepsis]|uniref:Uncharacterized protein n=1 Tax=Phototrophicus methaneseepsis TaxID=2710758 RepID=A0A7S8E7H9_9CHLR|nr:hypothetical protein [Phototrophicus methaneseepsis]QPC81728.1 hypothetical protein G4Y79_18835 [Phototrophicus methaneseepsis]